ncbi:MAG TPA: cbb3-type cytochrome oxidase assembly protein CcoS [Flavobacteriales bacterium]|jgi:cbb3-type cytochrome oxidase maturation protein
MSAFYIMIGASLPIAIGFLIAFILSARKGQFDDDFTPSIRMLTDDTPVDTDEIEQQQPNK